MFKKINLIIWLGLALLLLGCEDIALQPVVTTPTTAPTATPIQEQIVVIETAPPIDNEKLAEMNSVLKRITYLDGVTVNGVSIGGMTTEQAKAAVSESIAAAKAAYAVSVRDASDAEAEPVVFSGETVTIVDNLDEILTEAFALVREDTGYESVMAEAAAIAAGKPYEVTLSFDRDALRSAVNAYADAHDVDPIDASVYYNSNDNAIAYTDDVPGCSVDREALLEAVLSAGQGETIDAPTVAVEAEITRDNVESRFVLRGRRTTSFKGSTSNRKYNIRKGVGLITGTLMHPGDVFSMNETLGVRNKSNGWKLAGAYNSGNVVQEYGGGVCQLSSTLYNAVVKADLEIVYRQNHSMPVSYISEGLDATINSVGNIIDFKFKNNSRSDIIIIGYTDGNTLAFEIYGISLLEESDGEYDQIKIPTPKKTKTIKASGEAEVVVDYSKPEGYCEVSKGRDGSVYKSYKQYYLNEELVKEEDLATSTYKAYSKTITVGPNTNSDGSIIGANSNSGNNSGSSNNGDDSGNTNTGNNGGSSNTGNEGGNDSGSQSGGNDSGSQSGGNEGGSQSGGNEGGSQSGGNDGGSQSGQNDGGSQSGQNDGGSEPGGNDGE